MQYKKIEIFTAIEDYINDYVDTNGTSPAMSTIAKGVGINKSTVSRYVATMAEQGLIQYDEHRKVLTRQMLNDLQNMTRTPLRGSRTVSIVGSIACGSPYECEQYIEETVRLPKSIFGDGPLFILHASGESMLEAGIDSGDLVVVRQQQVAKEGDIIVALTEDGTTLKGYFPELEKKRIRLQPANSTMKPRYYKEITIQGVAVKIIKKVGTMGRGTKNDD